MQLELESLQPCRSPPNLHPLEIPKQFPLATHSYPLLCLRNRKNSSQRTTQKLIPSIISRKKETTRRGIQVQETKESQHTWMNSFLRGENTLQRSESVSDFGLRFQRERFLASDAKFLLTAPYPGTWLSLSNYKP